MQKWVTSEDLNAEAAAAGVGGTRDARHLQAILDEKVRREFEDGNLFKRRRPESNSSQMLSTQTVSSLMCKSPPADSHYSQESEVAHD